MPCFHPLDARRSPGGTIGFKPMTPFDKLLKLPCGRCKGCRLEKSRQWAIRLMHEAQMHQRTSFITLTIDDDHLVSTHPATSQSLVAGCSPPGLKNRGIAKRARAETRTHEGHHASLQPGDLKTFTNRLNTASHRKFGKGVRYYACGEYGDTNYRPHYHIAIFGEDFSDDRKFYKRSKSGFPLWRSSRLGKLWELGDADIGELTFESAAYIARYIMKKMNGPKADQHYKRIDNDVEYHLEPEFARMSRGKALGAPWFEKYRDSVYPHDRVIMRERPNKPPRAYDIYLKNTDQAMYDLVKANRELAIAKQNPANFTPERLRAGEAILAAALNQRNRPLE